MYEMILTAIGQEGYEVKHAEVSYRKTGTLNFNKLNPFSKALNCFVLYKLRYLNRFKRCCSPFKHFQVKLSSGPAIHPSE